MKNITTVVALAAVVATPALADGFGFRTPSGNIYCNGSLQGSAEIGCVIVNREAQPAGTTFAGCPAGRQVEVQVSDRGRATGVCGKPSGRLSSYSLVSEYGETGRFGQITCTSERTGFTCTNADGRGFFLSRRSQRVF